MAYWAFAAADYRLCLGEKFVSTIIVSCSIHVYADFLHGLI